MSEKLPYEEQLRQQLNDLPLPDENMAWEDMRRRLEKDDDDRIVPFWLNGCAGWGLLALFLLAIGWWIFRPEKLWQDKTDSAEVKTVQKEKDNRNKVVTDTVIFSQGNPNQPKQVPVPEPDDKTPADSTSEISTSDKKNSLTKRIKKETAPGPFKNPNNVAKQKEQELKHPVPEGNSKNIGNKNRNIQPPEARNKIDDNKDLKPGQKSIGEKNTTTPPADSIKNTEIVKTKNPILKNENAVDSTVKEIPGPTNTDTTKTINSDSTKNELSEQLVKPKADTSKKRQIYFAAGLGIHQLIPVDGQKLSPYSSSGRKSSLADYIPSVYFRMYREDRWFLQTEFRYGAPQYNREFLYSQEIDTTGPLTFTTSAKLKKTFYHQLPVTFNYFITKNWSAGGGFVWNRFSGAISEQDQTLRNNITQTDSVLSKGVIITTGSADTNFARSYFQAVVESQYRWKRFTIGARYSFGLQPYIKFSLPGGLEQSERNKSLQLFLRYELWRSKKKN